MAKINNEQEALLTVQEAAEFLRISQSTVYRMIKRGDLGAHRVGKKWVFFKNDLIKFVKGIDECTSAP
jgi:excisionase family DNA binding protein